jgi:DNA-directed RNA polymerase subunit N (RpoN/RPB10)
LWQELLTVHVGQGDGLHVSATPDYVPYRDAVGDERALCAAQLRAWARYVTEQRQVTPCADSRPATTAQFLATHLDWLCADEGAGTFCDAVHGRYAAAVRLLYPINRRTFVITAVDGSPARCLDCGEPLAALIRNTDDLLPSEIRCTGCGQAIPASLWITYGRQLKRASDCA